MGAIAPFEDEAVSFGGVGALQHHKIPYATQMTFK